MERDERPSLADGVEIGREAALDTGAAGNGAGGGAPTRRHPAASGSEPDEQLRIHTLIEIMRKAAEGLPRPVPRSSHAQHTALVHATFVVRDDVPAHLRKGLFAKPGRYPAYIRYSNVLHPDDRKGDAHGMAIKVLGVEGPKLLRRKAGGQEIEDDVQDFILMDNETFPTGDPAAFERLMRLQRGQSVPTKILSLLVLIFGHGGVLKRFRAATSKHLSSPLDAEYFSTVPSALGDDIAVKYAAIPREPRAGAAVDTETGLTEAVAHRLAAEDAQVVFDFCLDVQTDPEAQPIDDPSVPWSEAGATRECVAEIIIGHQEIDRALPLAENLSFNPWHGLTTHEPLGYLNRARRQVYSRLARFRHRQNGVCPRDSAAAPLSYEEGWPPQFSPLYWNAPPPKRGLIAWLGKKLRGLLNFIQHRMKWLYRLLLRLAEAVPAIQRLANRLLIGHFAGLPPQRPLPLSLWTPSDKPVGRKAPLEFRPYVSWTGITDRTFTGRHLPPMDSDDVALLPDVNKVADLFARRKKNGQEVFIPSQRSNALFCFFAQWLSDSFLRTHPDDARRNTSNHELDLCQIYGLGQESTRLLREKAGGRLKSQVIEGVGEMPVYLVKPGTREVDPELERICFDPIQAATTFDQCEPPHGRAGNLRELIIASMNDDDWAVRDGRFEKFYAGGLERANSTLLYSCFNTLFLREHNRLAGELRRRYRIEDDDWLFETARNINMAKYIKILIEDYINHLTGGSFPVRLEPGFADHCAWYRANRISLEFNLVYRWHSLVPETFVVRDAVGQPTVLWEKDFRFNNKEVETYGIERLIDSASRQRAGMVGLHNTPGFLMPAELATVRISRQFRLASFNAYRVRWGQTPYADFEALTGTDTPEQRALAQELAELYRNEDGEPDVDLVELPIGLYAEGRSGEAVLPKLLSLMVASDAFSHALTNPLLAAFVFGEDSLTPYGLEEFHKVRSFADIVAGVSATAEPPRASFAMP